MLLEITGSRLGVWGLWARGYSEAFQKDGGVGKKGFGVVDRDRWGHFKRIENVDGKSRS